MIKQKNLFDVCEIAISYYPKIKPKDRPKVTNSKEIYDHIIKYVDKGEINYREVFLIITLDRSNGIIGIKEIGKGGMSGVTTDPKLIFQTALLSHASSIIIAHNHPSSNLKPSVTDENLTKKVAEAGKVLDLHLLDHLVFNNDSYYSFADENNVL